MKLWLDLNGHGIYLHNFIMIYNCEELSEIHLDLLGVISHSRGFNELGVIDREEYESLTARLVMLRIRYSQDPRIG